MWSIWLAGSEEGLSWPTAGMQSPWRAQTWACLTDLSGLREGCWEPYFLPAQCGVLASDL